MPWYGPSSFLHLTVTALGHPAVVHSRRDSNRTETRANRPLEALPRNPPLTEAIIVKKAVFFLIEVLGFTLFTKAIATLIFGLPANSMAAQVGIWFLFGLAILLLAWIFNKLLRGWRIQDLGFRCHKSFVADLWLGVCGFAVSNLLTLPFDLMAIDERANMAHAIVGQFHFSSSLQVLVGGTALAAALGFFTGAFHEEIRFRGYYQGAGSSAVTPLAGLLIGLIPFSLGHYYAHPDWSFVQVLATLVPGIIYALLFHATRSLIVVMTAHTLDNVLPFIPFLLHEITGRRAVTLTSIGTLGLLSLLLIVLRWNRELRSWRNATQTLFTDRPYFGVATGALIGLALLALWPHEFRPQYSALAGALLFAIVYVGRTVKSS